MTLVTAVVTTTGRESLARACAGVLSQTVPAELVIVVDSSDAWVHSAVTTAYPSAEVLPSAARNGSASRNIGMRAARGRYIAFLDDDDWWEPTWLETAVETARRVDGAGSAPVIVTGAASFHRTSGRVQVLPARPMPREPRLVLDELVRRRYVASASAFVQTSAMVVNRPVAEAVAWPEELPRHQDWEFFRQVTRRTASEWRHVDTPLVHVAQGSAQSVSASPAWQASLAWLERVRPDLSPEAESDFLVHQVLRDALACGSLDGIRAVRARLAQLRRFGSARAWLVAGARGGQGGLTRLRAGLAGPARRGRAPAPVGGSAQ